MHAASSVAILPAGTLARKSGADGDVYRIRPIRPIRPGLQH
jgi:hypothetical protein